MQLLASAIVHLCGREQLCEDGVPVTAYQDFVMEERLVSFNLFGQEFSFYSDAPEDEVQGAIAMLRDELEGTDLAARSTIPSSTMLVLGCLRLAGSYVRLNKEYSSFRTQQEQSVAKLIDKVSSCIE